MNANVWGGWSGLILCDGGGSGGGASEDTALGDLYGWRG